MKIVIASDIHGSAIHAKKLREVVEREQPEKLVLLGDLLYHGARNDLPRGYNVKEVYDTLNSMKDIIIAIRGNCDSEVDQMVLKFPMMDDYKTLEVDGITWYLTHGHVNGLLPQIGDNDILFNGHYHVYQLTRNHINPGSIGIPKENPEHTYIIYENGVFSLYDLNGDKIEELII